MGLDGLVRSLGITLDDAQPAKPPAKATALATQDQKQAVVTHPVSSEQEKPDQPGSASGTDKPRDTKPIRQNVSQQS